MITFISMITFLIILTLIVGIHELGHLLTAKYFNIFCPEYSIGMGKVFFKKKIKETIYNFRLLPFGGFVKILDYKKIDFDKSRYYYFYIKNNNISIISDKIINDKFNEKITIKKYKINEIQLFYNHIIINALDEKNKKISFNNIENSIKFFNNNQEELIIPNRRNFFYLNTFKKILILSSGVIFNFFLALIVFFISFFIIGVNYDPIIEEDAINKNNNFEKQFKKNDKIISLNNKKINDVNEISKILTNYDKEFIHVEVERENKIININRRLISESFKEISKDGLITKNTKILNLIFIRTHNIYHVIVISIKTFFSTMINMLLTIYCLFLGKINIQNLTGFIGMAQYTYNIVNTNYIYSINIILSKLLIFCGIISMNVGIMNLIPIPILDGGRILILLLNKIFNNKIDDKIINFLNTASIILLILLFFYITGIDLLRLKGGY